MTATTVFVALSIVTVAVVPTSSLAILSILSLSVTTTTFPMSSSLFSFTQFFAVIVARPSFSVVLIFVAVAVAM